MTPDVQLEALLFYRGEPTSRSRIEKMLGMAPEALEEAVRALRANLATRGLRLLDANGELELVTAPEASAIIAAARKDELTRDLGKAGAETLAIVLYRGPATRAQIDYIRGVNSTFILRNLQVRGLIERVPNPENSRSSIYRATSDLLAHLGLTRVEELPGYAEAVQALALFEQEKAEETLNA